MNFITSFFDSKTSSETDGRPTVTFHIGKKSKLYKLSKLQGYFKEQIEKENDTNLEIVETDEDVFPIMEVYCLFLQHGKKVFDFEYANGYFVLSEMRFRRISFASLIRFLKKYKDVEFEEICFDFIYNRQTWIDMITRYNNNTKQKKYPDEKVIELFDSYRESHPCMKTKLLYIQASMGYVFSDTHFTERMAKDYLDFLHLITPDTNAVIILKQSLNKFPDYRNFLQTHPNRELLLKHLTDLYNIHNLIDKKSQKEDIYSLLDFCRLCKNYNILNDDEQIKVLGFWL